MPEHGERVSDGAGGGAKRSAPAPQEPSSSRRRLHEPAPQQAREHPGGATCDAKGPDDLGNGALVRVFGLQGAKELNGQYGDLQDFNSEKGRWYVDIEGFGTKLIRPNNLKLAKEEVRKSLQDGDWVKLRSFDKTNRLNGRHGRLQYETEPGRWQVNIEGIGFKVVDVEFLRPTRYCGPQERTNGQYHGMAGLESDFREADFESCPMVSGIDTA